MKYVLGFLAAAVLSVGSFAAHAEDSMVSPTGAPAAASAEAAADAAAVVAPVEHTLADGTKVVVDAGKVFVVGADGAKTAAPDGEHKLKDGGTLTTKVGAVVTAPAADHGHAPAAAPAPAEAAPAH